jgi:hypothetical protein
MQKMEGPGPQRAAHVSEYTFFHPKTYSSTRKPQLEESDIVPSYIHQSRRVCNLRQLYMQHVAILAHDAF